MTMAVAGIGIVYLGVVAIMVAALVHAILVRDLGVGLGAVMFLVAVPALLWHHYSNLAEDLLRVTKARPGPEGDDFVAAAERLAAAADVAPAPDVIVAPSKIPNALVVPTRGKPLIVVTAGLLDALTREEVE